MRALWIKLLMAERLQPWAKTDKCIWSGVVDSHRRLHAHCRYTPFALDTVNKGFIHLRDGDQRTLNLTDPLADHPLQSLSIIKGLGVQQFRACG